MTDRLKDKLVLFLAGLGIVSYFVIIVVELCSTPRFQHLTNLTAPDTEVEVGSFVIGTVAWIILVRMRTTNSTRQVTTHYFVKRLPKDPRA